ncbi:MAG: pilus assembly protein PilO [Betaproteobacteria bacterium RBG_16_58_11]|nr:MAG: pilus assembly protein PilO [Betaproteobacteria bacterium RBG_16_58_11]
MSLADDINKLNFKDMGVWPAPFKVAAMAILFGALLLAGYWFIWKDQMEALDQSRQEEQKLRTEFLDKKKQALNLDLYREQVKEIEQAFGALVRQLPNKSEMDALLTDINQAGLGRGLEFELFKPAPETMRDFYAELPITVRITGSYHDLGRFVSDVAQLPRIVTLNNLAISQGKDGVLALDAVAMTYRYLDEEEIAKTKKAAKDKGAKK